MFASPTHSYRPWRLQNYSANFLGMLTGVCLQEVATLGAEKLTDTEVRGKKAVP